MRSLNVAATGMMAQQLHVEVISNNIANMATTGYKRSRPEFQDLLYQVQRRLGTATSDVGTIVPAGVHLGLGVKTAAVSRIHEQGALLSTSNDLDVAIQGSGYFIIETPAGDFAYTRAGSFGLSPGGMIVTADGYPVAPGIVLPEDAVQISIAPNGIVQAKLQNVLDPVDLGQIELARFVNEAGLEAIGGNLYLESASSGPPQIDVPGAESFGTLLQAHLENANVNPVTEITSLITAQRAYDMSSRVISASDEMLATMTQMR
jgi:flagellar basal-body rod protein FlgG